MGWRGWSLVGGFAAAVLGAVFYMRRKVAAAMTDDDRAGPDGIVKGKPEDLARAAGVPVDVYSLARVMQSEESSRAGRIAVGWATRNAATRGKITVTKLVTRSDKASAAGKYGRQDAGPKWCATSQAPTADVLEIAKQILAEPPKVPDPTKGASQWDAPGLQDKLHKQNPAKWKSAEEIAAKRKAAGKKLVMVPGIEKTRFWA